MSKQIHTLEDITQDQNGVIFLAGPTLRDEDRKNWYAWRDEAVKFFCSFGFTGTLIIPEFSLTKERPTYKNEDIWEWERSGLALADVIMFWVPRDMKYLPGLTTNIEFGAWMDKEKVVFGAPIDAPHTAYMRFWCRKLGIPEADTLAATVHLSLLSLAHKRFNESLKAKSYPSVLDELFTAWGTTHV